MSRATDNPKPKDFFFVVTKGLNTEVTVRSADKPGPVSSTKILTTFPG
jgi:hypothetical protein